MPKQMLPPKEAFHAFFEEMREKHACRVLERKEVLALFEKIPVRFLKLKKKKKGIETCLYYRIGFFEVIWWSTFVDSEGSARNQDEGWVLVIDTRFPNKPSLFSFPIRRTKNYLTTTAEYLDAFIELARTWPSCPVCGEKLRLKLAGTEMHAVAFYCPKGHRRHSFSLYQNLSKKNALFLEGKFKRYAMYRIRDEEKTGKIRQPSRIIRANKKKKMLSSHLRAGRTIDTSAYNDLQYEHLS